MQSSTAEMPARALKNILKIEGPPGSGKTFALVREACRLIGEEGLLPAQILILAVTPLNKRRLSAYLKREARQAGLTDATVSILTWEEWLLGLLKTYGTVQDQQVQLLSDADARILLQEVLRQVVPPGHPLYYASRQSSFARVVFELIRQLQLHHIAPGDLADLAKKASGSEGRLSLIAEVFQRFIERTEKVSLLCQAELINRVLEVISVQSPGIAERYPVILADDAQELSQGHHQCLAFLAERLVLAGNEKLSIRSFRGAMPEVFEALSVYGQSPVTFLPQQACMRNNEAVLSLLNTFLHNLIWEEQGPNLSQLRDFVQFSLFQDPEQEAEGIAGFIERFVRHEKLDGCSATWDDCVILLRSSYYQPHLVHALSQRGIPFRMEVVSDRLLRFQHAFYDLLSVMEGWQKLSITPTLLQTPETLQTHWANLALPVVEQWELVRLNNRHLHRWLEAMLSDDVDEPGTTYARAIMQPQSDEAALLLLRLTDLATLPAKVAAAVQQLFSLYTLYWQTGCPVSLLDSVVHWLTTVWRGGEQDEPAVEPGEDSLLVAIDGFRQNLERLNGYYLSTFGQSLPLAELLSSFQSLWQGADSNSASLCADGAVRLMSIHQVQGEEFACVAVPFLVSGEFPYTRETPQVLSASEEALLSVPLSYRIDEAEEARLLAVALSRATHQLMLSCHAQDTDTPVLPSAFYQKLLNGKRTLLGSVSLSTVCPDDGPCDLYACYRHSESGAAGESENLSWLAERYGGESKWAKLPRENALPLFASEESLYLSASSIKTYMTCPRQFYYRHLLRLPQPGNDAATLGSLIHRVMEVFNAQAKTQPYTAARLRVLAEAMFLFQEDEDAFFQAGFRDEDLYELRRLSPLTLSALRQRLLDSIEDLERKGYFERYGKLKQIYPEKVLEGFQVEGLERCRFSGAVDALVQLDDGSWDIIDYKTYRSAYSVGLDTCDKRFLETLDPLPGDEDISHAERFADKLSSAYPKDYQLPLYYLACSQDPIYRGKLTAVTLQVMRPAFPENPNQGAIRLQIPASAIEANKQQMIQDIRRFIVDPILGSSVFSTSPGRSSCGSCGYFGICDSRADAGGEE
jgi:superfamily I DNA/RNA helicase